MTPGPITNDRGIKMTISACPVCGKRISSRAPRCPHCGADPSADDQDQLRQQRVAWRKKYGRLQLELGLAMTLLVICAGVMIFQSQYGLSTPSSWAIGGAVIAAIWYAVTRVRIYLAKRG